MRKDLGEKTAKGGKEKWLVRWETWKPENQVKNNLRKRVVILVEFFERGY